MVRTERKEAEVFLKEYPEQADGATAKRKGQSETRMKT
jgi:hypothetical protein